MSVTSERGDKSTWTQDNISTKLTFQNEITDGNSCKYSAKTPCTAADKKQGLELL